MIHVDSSYTFFIDGTVYGSILDLLASLDQVKICQIFSIHKSTRVRAQVKISTGNVSAEDFSNDNFLLPM
eukprot:SAG11_NODE_10138_length_852_cov_1.111554_1_plen_69_part_10